MQARGGGVQGGQTWVMKCNIKSVQVLLHALQLPC